MSGPRIIFYDWPYSPFCMKVRAILDHKGLSYERENPLGPRLRYLRRRGKTGKVPAIEIDGEMIADSTDIAYALNERFPDPPLLPTDKRDRALCHVLEDWADESLYFIGLYYRWFEAEGRKPVARVFRKARFGVVFYHYYLRLILRQLKGQGTLRKSTEHVRRDLARHLHAVDALLTPGPYLLGATPYLCDFALWGQLNYLSRTPVGADVLQDHKRAAEFISRLSRPL